MLNNEESKSSHIRITNMNSKKINEQRRKKVYRNRAILGIAASAIVFLSGIGIGKAITKNSSNVPVLEDGKVLTTITMDVEYGDTLSEIANNYYNDSYDSFYGSLSNYEKIIKEQNKINNGDYLSGNRKLEIPVIVDENNIYLKNVIELKQKIKEMEDNNLWIDYTVESGDNIYYLASLASSGGSDTIENVQRIASKNGISTKEILNIGTTIKIMNPSLGSLKMELSTIEEAFKESLQNNLKTK